MSHLCSPGLAPSCVAGTAVTWHHRRVPFPLLWLPFLSGFNVRKAPEEIAPVLMRTCIVCIVMVWHCEDRLAHEMPQCKWHGPEGRRRKCEASCTSELLSQDKRFCVVPSWTFAMCGWIRWQCLWTFAVCQRKAENGGAPTVCVRASFSACQLPVLLLAHSRAPRKPRARMGKVRADIPESIGQSSSWAPHGCQWKKLKCSPSWIECCANSRHGQFNGTQLTQSLLHLSICAMRRFSLCHSIECVDCLPSFVHTTNQSITAPTWSTSKEGALRHINTLRTGCNILVDFQCARTYRHTLCFCAIGTLWE